MGIAGSGISAAAVIAQAQGLQISGCDIVLKSEFVQGVALHKIPLHEGHSPDHLQNVDVLAISPAILSLDPNNPELLAAKERGIPVFNWKEFMAKYLEKDHFVIAVAGTHGKSTTTAMIGLMLEDARLDPTVVLGAIVPTWGSNFRIGKGKYFVVEADEFNRDLLYQNPDIAVVTTIEMDHPETYQNFEEYKESFRQFLQQAKQTVIYNGADQGIKEVTAMTYPGQTVDYSKHLIDFPLLVPGGYNRLNASAVFRVGLALKIDPQIIQKSLSNFTGIGRRFEKMGQYKDAVVYSDFGHHPTEIKVTLEAAREKFPDKKIAVIFQPHMFSRTYALFDDFVRVLHNAPVDEINVMDIYPSREKDTGLVNSKQLVKAINKKSVTYIPDREEVLKKVQAEGRTDIIFFLGAGSTHELAKRLINNGKS